MPYRIQNLLLTTICLIVFSTFQLSAQTLLIEEGTLMHNDEPRACIRVQMDPLPKEVKKAWHDYLDDNYDIDLKGIGFLSNKDMLKAEGVNFPEITDKGINLYTRVVEQGNLTEMCVFASLGHDIYLNANDYPVEFQRLQNTVEAFIGSYLPNHYQNLVKETEEELEDLIDRRKNLSDDISDNLDKITKLEKENREKNRELTTVEEQIRNMTSILDARRDKLQQIDRRLINQRFR